MDIRKIIVPVTGTDAGLPSLNAAFTIARHLGAHVEGLHARQSARDSLAYIGEGMTGAMIEELIATSEQEGARLARRARGDFAKACETADFEQTEAMRGAGEPTAHLRLETGREEELIGVCARVSDLVVIARAARDSEVQMRAALESALLESGRPLCVIPPNGISGSLANLAIGWNGGAEASRAVSHALPLLAKAERVTVIQVEEGLLPGPLASDIVDYLAWHGIDATVHKARSQSRSTGEALLEDARNIDAGMLIMGAYTHSRLRRMIFGSATEHMLGEADIPVFMMH